MINSSKYLKIVGVAIVALLFLNSCDSDYVGIEEETAPGLQIVNSAEFGKVLVDQNHQALYFFANDIAGESSCNGGCASVWPALEGEVADFELGASLDIGDFGTIARENGVKQITHKGWPLYYFSPEGDGVLEASGAVSGDGKNDVFYVAKPDYSIASGRRGRRCSHLPGR